MIPWCGTGTNLLVQLFTGIIILLCQGDPEDGKSAYPDQNLNWSSETRIVVWLICWLIFFSAD